MTLRALSTATLLVALSGLAQANTVTFNGLIDPNPGNAGNGTDYSEGGLTFTAAFLEHWGQNDTANADPGGATLYHAAAGPMVTTQVGGGSFNLTSFALAEADNNFDVVTPTDISFSYTDGGGVHNSILTIDATPGLQTYVLNRPGITSFTLDGVEFQIDNVVFTPVPEPAAFGMLLAGLLAVGTLARRRRN